MRTFLRAAAGFFLLIVAFFAIDTMPAMAQSEPESDLVSSEASVPSSLVVSAGVGGTTVSFTSWSELNLYNKKEARAYFNLTENVPMTLTWGLHDPNGTQYGPFTTHLDSAGRHELTDERLKFPNLQAGQFVTLTTSINGGEAFTVASEYKEGGPQWVTVVPVKNNAGLECSAYRKWHLDIHMEQKAFWDGGQQDYPAYDDNSGNDDGVTPVFDYPQTDKPFWLENTSWNPKNVIKHHSIRGPYYNPCFVKPVPTTVIQKIADADRVQAGQQIGFKVVVTSTGNTTATNVNLLDTLPMAPGLNWSIDLAASDQGCSIDGNVLRCNFGDLAPGQTRKVHIVSPTTGETSPVCGAVVLINNTATVSSDDAGTGSDDAATGVECLPAPAWEAKRITAIAYSNTGNVDLTAGEVNVPGCKATFTVLHPGEDGYFICEATPIDGVATYNGQPVQPTLGILTYQWVRDPNGHWIFMPILLK